MSLNYLLDENVDPTYKAEILTRNPNLIIWCVGEPEAPSRGTLDPDNCQRSTANCQLTNVPAYKQHPKAEESLHSVPKATERLHRQMQQKRPKTPCYTEFPQ